MSEMDSTPVEVEEVTETDSDTITGVVKWFNSQKGYGFITPDNGSEDVFAHYRNIVGDGYRNLEEDQRVEFVIESGDKGLLAANIRVID